ncbi:acyltransferase family protein, partial [Streptomyces sp. NPDC059680]|uniref:acyltransferase family protein n=1 Tax=Streptomyces sp. NPDC059680 TaxID=3346904 RepID=UPI0036C7A5C7
MAALSTVVFHVWQQYTTYDAGGAHVPVGSGWVAPLFSLEVIDLFFVMSAYLLTLSYARAAIDGRPVRAARVFLFRRAVRIVPLYYLAVLTIWAWRNPVLPGNWPDLVEHLTFTHVFDRERIFYTLGPTWSLSLEVFFYLVLVVLGPLAVRLCGRLARRRTRVAVCAAGCAVLFTVPCLWMVVVHDRLQVAHTDWPVYFGPPARFAGFAAGMALAVTTVALGGRARPGRSAATLLAAAAVAGVVVLSYASYTAHQTSPDNLAATFYHPVASLMWALLLFAMVHTHQRCGWHRWLTVRPLTGLGLISYSLFIWHEPIMLQLHAWGLLPTGRHGFLPATVIVLLAAIPAATLSYRLIEYPTSLLTRLQNPQGHPHHFYPQA